MLLDPDQLNADCTCISLDRAALCRALEAEVGDAEFCHQLAASHPTLISSLPVFLRGDHVARMAAIIRAIEAVAKLEGYQAAALQSAPASAQFRLGAIGVFRRDKSSNLRCLLMALRNARQQLLRRQEKQRVNDGP
jgi:hypothetical protein